MGFYLEYSIVKKLVENIISNPNDILYDLGCGDGRIIIECAKAGIRSKGIESDLEIVKIAKEKIKELGLQNCSVIHGDFTQLDWSDGTIIIVNQGTTELETIKQKLQPGMKVISVDTKIPNFDSNLVRTIPVNSSEEAFVLYLYGNYADLKDHKLSHLVSNQNHTWMKNTLVRKPKYDLHFYEVN